MTNAQYFSLRRLHSLVGVFPLGVFLLNHLLVNASAMLGAEFFEHKVALIHSLGRLLPIVEAGFIFIPLAIHIALGVFIACQARYEVRAGKEYGRNWAYIFQRITGWAALVYISYHVIHLSFLHAENSVKPYSVTLSEMFYGPMGMLYIPLYLAGGLAVIFHFANGLCTFCMTWGITVGAKSQKAMSFAAAGVGGLLSILLISSIAAFWREGSIRAGKTEAERASYTETLKAIHAEH